MMDAWAAFIVAAGTNPPLFAGEVAVLISSAPEVQMAP
jgi:hypothetical protein